MRSLATAKSRFATTSVEPAEAGDEPEEIVGLREDRLLRASESLLRESAA